MHADEDAVGFDIFIPTIAAGGFDGETASPKSWAEMEADFRNVLLGSIWTQAAAADMLVAIEQVNGPILKIVHQHAVDFRRRAFGRWLGRRMVRQSSG